MHKTKEEAEEPRSGYFDELKAELATVEDGSSTWQELKSEITSYSQLVKAVQSAPHAYNERIRVQMAPYVNN